ncbi:MAG: hypothetical protein WBL63_06380 [Candidatus Acidiferrum sp.]
MRVLILRLGLVTMTLAGSSLLFGKTTVPATPITPARVAIYYGYPSLVNGSSGDVEKAASVFSAYDVVVLGDGLEFPDKEFDRYPPGDPEEHRKVRGIIAAVRGRNPKTRFYGYVCLGEISAPMGEKISLTPEQLEERVRLWKQMGVAGIFLDEAGYDFAVVTRKRQNMAVKIIHELGLSAFLNAYFLDHLFSLEDKLPYANGTAKNPERLPPLLDRRDLFLLESFQVRNGNYESTAAWQARLKQALRYRQRYGAHIFATTTTTEQEPFSSEKFNYAWWTALLYGLDGFSWGEPDFAALTNALPDRHCGLDKATLGALDQSPTVGSDNRRFWRRASDFLVVVDTTTHFVYRVPCDTPVEPKNIETFLLSPRRESLLACGGGA